MDISKIMLYLCGVLINYNTTMLNLDHVFYSYPGNPKPVIKDFSMGIAPGGIYGLLGANGTGKSTLLYLISGLLKPSTGSISFKGQETFLRLPSTLTDVFLVPEEIELPAVTLDKFVALNAPFYEKFNREEMNEYLRHFRLDPDIHLGRLSMGQRKKAFVAFALACNTSLLLMDEPTNGLDIPGKSEFRRAIVSAMSDNRTIIISTHQVRDLERVLDHVVIVDNNGVVMSASIADIQNRLVFRFTTDPDEIAGSLWSMPVPGGYNVVRFRGENVPETEVNLESLFQLAFTNPQLTNAL